MVCINLTRGRLCTRNPTSSGRSFAFGLLLSCGATLAFVNAASAQGLVVGLDVWYVDVLNRNIYRVNPANGAVLNVFLVPGAVTTPEGLAVSGVVGGGTNLWLLDAAPGGQIYRLNPFTGFVQDVRPKPSPDSVGLGAACVVPVNAEELFVVANDLADPGALYWIQPVGGGVLNRCSLGVPVPQILDATAFALGANGTGVCFLVDLPPLGVGGGTQLRCVNKITCATLLLQNYAWDGWGLGNRTVGNSAGTATELFASDRVANVLHVLNAATGVQTGVIPLAPGVQGVDVRGVGGDSTCVPSVPSRGVAVPALSTWGAMLVGAAVLALGVFLILRR